MEATTAQPDSRDPGDGDQFTEVPAMGFELERILRPLLALVERIEGAGRRTGDDRRFEEMDRAEDVARFSAKELQDFLDRHEDRGAIPSEAENDLRLAISLIVALNSMACLFPMEGNSARFPENEERWTLRLPRREVVSAILWLSDHATDLFLRDSVGSRWTALMDARRQEEVAS